MRSCQLRLCSACQVAAYCSSRCQQEAWLEGHRQRCEAYLEDKVVTQTDSTGTNQGGGSHDEAGEQEDDGQAAIDETEAAAQSRGVPGHAGEISTKTVCFNSQPEFAPSQKILSDDEGEENRCGIPTGDLKTSPPRPRSILKSFENPSNGSRAAVGSNPLKSDGACLGSVIECISSASEPEPSPPPGNRKPNPGTFPPPSAGSSSSSPSSDRQKVDVTPPNSPSVLASIGKSSQAKPKSNKRRTTLHPKGSHYYHPRVGVME